MKNEQYIKKIHFMDNLTISAHFNKLISEIQHTITNGNIDDKVYNNWINDARIPILNDLKNEYEKIHNFYNNPNLYLPDIIVDSSLQLYSIHFDQRLDCKKLEDLLKDFIKNELGFEKFTISLIKNFFSITILFDKNEFNYNKVTHS